MSAFSVATGTTLLYDEGILPPNPARQVLAFASQAEASKLGSDGLAFRTTATDLAMEDHTADGSAELSPEAMQFLIQDLASSPAAPKSQSTQTAPQLSSYPYGGWSTDSSPAPASPTAVASAPINVLA